MKRIALAVDDTGGQSTIKGVSADRGVLWLPVRDSAVTATRVAITLLAQGCDQVAVDVPDALRETPQRFYVPSRIHPRLAVAQVVGLPKLRARAEALGCPAVDGVASERSGGGTVFTDASDMGGRGAFGWAARDGRGEVRFAAPGCPTHLLEMEAICLALEGTVGDVHVVSDCLVGLKLLSGRYKARVWRAEVEALRGRVEAARQGRRVNMSWVRAHAKTVMNLRVDALVWAAAHCAPQPV